MQSKKHKVVLRRSITNMKRFKVIRHRNGTRTLIDNQTGMQFFCANDESVERSTQILREGRPTNTAKWEEN